MKADEARDLGTVSGSVLRQVTQLTRGAHAAVSDAVFSTLSRGLGPTVLPIKAAQDTISAGAYSATGVGLDLAARATGMAVAQRLRRGDDVRPSLHDGPAAHYAVAIGLGLWGDAAERTAAAVAPAMHVRRGRRHVPWHADDVVSAFPDATGQVAVFLHGLFETEAAWRLGAATNPPYAERLADELGLTPVMVRYNTGLRISDNAGALDALLTDLVANWPVAVERLVLIGHSMGGLVLHGAMARAASESTWLPLVTETVTLGSPHHGSPVARGVHRATVGLDALPRLSFLGDVLRLRSAGIRDLAYGNVVAADWEGHDAERLADTRTHPVPHDGARHHAVVAVATPRLPQPIAETLGDFLVPVASAAHADLGQMQRRFTDDGVAVVTGLHHLKLLNDDRVYAHLRTWLAATD